MKLINLLLEAEAEKQEADVLAQLKGQMNNLVNNIDSTLQDKTEEQNESLLTVAGLAIAMPAILGIVSKFGKMASGIINKVMGKKPTKKEEEENWFAKLGKIADDLHHLYQAPLKKVVSKFVKDPAKAEKVSHFLFHVIIAVMLLASGVTAVKALQSKEISVATLETALATVKGGEIKNYISKLLA
jgi:Flp pilus assembly pilin Flp